MSWLLAERSTKPSGQQIRDTKGWKSHFLDVITFVNPKV